LVTIFPPAGALALWSWVVSGGKGAWDLASAMLAALTIFGPVRILHACIASESTWRYFFTEAERDKACDRAPFEQSQSFGAHFLPGVAYIILFTALATACAKIAELPPN
jgi:hypothetical protein